MSDRMPWGPGRRLFALSLRAFPRAFRERHREGLLATFDHQAARVSDKGLLRRSAFLFASITDALVSGVAERLGAMAGWHTAVGEGVRSAVRGALRAPGFTAAVVVTFALGLGVNTTMYGIADRLLLRPPEQVRDPDRVFHIYFERRSPFLGTPEVSPAFSYPDLTDLEKVGAFQAVAGFSPSTRTLGSGRGAERVRVELATASYFDVLGVRPELGRFFSRDEDKVEGGTLVAVLAHGYWMRRFGGDPGVVGRELRLGPGRYTIVGVAPAGFTGATIGTVDLWVPLRTTQAMEHGDAWVSARQWIWFRAVARLRDGREPAAAAAEATAAHVSGREALIRVGSYDPDAQVVLSSLVLGRVPDAVSEVGVSRWLVAVAALVLLIACANVANLLLLRAVRRRRELAIRVALGISRGRLLAQLLSESFLLASVAGGAAVLAARLGGGLVYRTLLPGFDPGEAFHGPRLVLFALAAAGLTSLLAGGVPALLAARVDVNRDLRGGGRGSQGGGRLRAGLLVVQVALSVVLLCGAGVFLRSLVEVGRLELGFEPEGVLVANVETDDGFSNAESERAIREAAERLRGAPGVEAVAATSLPPLSGLWGLPLFRAPGDSVATQAGPYFYVATPDYFRVMGMRILRGRGFQASDAAPGASPVMVLTEGLAERIFVGQDPLGRCLFVGGAGPSDPCTEIVGILGDHRSTALVEEASLLFYVPPGHPAARPMQSLVVRFAGEDPTRAIAAVREAVLQAEPGVRYVAVAPLTDRVDARTRSWRMGATLLSVFGVLALGVAGLGLYAVIGFEVAQRRVEIGIRAALGARRAGLVWMVFREALTRTATGVAIGAVAVMALARLAGDLLFRTSPTDPGVLTTVGLTLLAVAAVAAARPAIGASGVEPTEALRDG